MNDHRPLLVWLLALVALVGTGAVGARQLPADEPLSMDLKEANLADVLRSLALIRNLEPDLGPSLDGKVTVSVENVPWQSIVDSICHVHRLDCQVVDGVTLFVRPRALAPAADQGQPISMSLREADLFATLKAFGRISDMTVEIDPQLPPDTITVSLIGVPWPRALEGVCQLGGCAIEVRESVIHVLPIDPGTRPEGIELENETVNLRTLFEQFAGLRLLGQTVRTDIDPQAAEHEVTLDLEGATWSSLLDRACRQAGCDWALVFDGNEPLSLRVRFLGPQLEAALEMTAFAGTLRDAAAHFGRAVGLDVHLDPALDPEQPVTLKDTLATGVHAADALCRQIDCGWHLDGRRLVFRPRVPLLSATPPLGSRAPRVAVRFVPPAPDAPLEADANFHWAKTAQQIGTGDAGTWALHLSWLPFGDAGQVVLPLVARCGAPTIDQRLASLPPVALPLDAAWHATALGAQVTLEPSDATRRPTARRGGRCWPHDPTRIVVAFPDLDRQALSFAARPGAYLLVTPPPRDARESPPPAAAIVALGTDREGHWSIGVVRPGEEGAPPTLERIDLMASTPTITSLSPSHAQRLSIRAEPAS